MFYGRPWDCCYAHGIIVTQHMWDSESVKFMKSLHVTLYYTEASDTGTNIARSASFPTSVLGIKPRTCA